MTIKKLEVTPGVNRENTRYSSEGGWYECDKVRFRQGFPEKIGGWIRLTSNTFLGICRSLWKWALLTGDNLIGMGTNVKMYIEKGGIFYDITPLRETEDPLANDPFSASDGSDILTVTDTSHGASEGAYVTFSGATGLGGNVTAAVLNQEYEIKTVPSLNTYTIQMSVTANSSDTGGGGAAVKAEYQINIGSAVSLPFSGWGGGNYNGGPLPNNGSTWGNSAISSVPSSLRIWNQQNFGEDLVFGIRNGPLYYWNATNGLTTRGVDLDSLPLANKVPIVHYLLLISDISRFVFTFGCNTIFTSVFDPMLIRWSDQENISEWEPLATNTAGDLRLSRGSAIEAVIQARQEVLCWTDIALYSLQYIGAPDGWGAQIVGDNISIASAGAVAYANGIAYWMGRDKFYSYSGQVLPLECDLRRYVFDDFNKSQYPLVIAGTNESFHEVWWFYCSENSNDIDRYVVYNYQEGLWYYGTMARSAWLDSGSDGKPVAATYENKLVIHETGHDDGTPDIPQPITSYISSSEFDIDDGDRFSFIWRLLPDITFEGSDAENPSVDFTLSPLKASGSGYNAPKSVGGESTRTSTRGVVTVPVEQYTEQLNIRVRGRQMSLRVESSDLGVAWQLGYPRIDIRSDGQRG
jgi:hypothetical protein